MFFPDEPFSVEVVRELASLLRANNLGELSLESKGEDNPVRLQIQRESVSYVPAASSQVASFAVPESAPLDPLVEEQESVVVQDVREIGAPCVGIYRSPKKPIYVGDHIRNGQIIAVVESLRVPNEVVATFDATVVELPVLDGQGVEWGETLVVLSSGS